MVWDDKESDHLRFQRIILIFAHTNQPEPHLEKDRHPRLRQRNQCGKNNGVFPTFLQRQNCPGSLQ